jgi:Zn ribbon nucleic-acid-binding protein
MLSFLNMECPACEAEYTLSIEELNVLVLFRCFECGQNSMYVAGHVLTLDDEIMETGGEEDKKRHIIETAQAFVMEFAGNVVGNVERIINVNMETDLSEKRRGRGKKRKWRRTRKKEIEDPAPRLTPSIKRINAPEITSREVSDFTRIDLKLIDKKEFFDRFFKREKK